MNTTVIVAWLLSLMVWKAPPERLANLPGSIENAEDRQARYALIAADAAEVAFDPAESPLYKGKKGRAETAVTLIAIGYHESGFRKDVDLGPCKKGECDGGKAACIDQIEIGDGKTKEGWTKADLFADRKKCFRVALRLIRSSFKACIKLGPEFVFDAYAQGICDSRVESLAHKRGLELYSLTRAFMNHTSIPLDSSVTKKSDAISIASETKSEVASSQSSPELPRSK